MRTGKLNISRGSQLGESPSREPKLTLVAASPANAALAPEAPTRQACPTDPQPIQHRLDALERLARLRTQDLLSPEEFAAEKALILAPPGNAASRRPAPAGEAGHPPQPSLLGRMLSWKFLPIGLVAGLALSFGAQPQETMRFFDQALRLVGA